jgi:hypothetical protein
MYAMVLAAPGAPLQMHECAAKLQTGQILGAAVFKPQVGL